MGIQSDVGITISLTNGILFFLFLWYLYLASIRENHKRVPYSKAAKLALFSIVPLGELIVVPIAIVVFPIVIIQGFSVYLLFVPVIVIVGIVGWGKKNQEGALQQ